MKKLAALLIILTASISHSLEFMSPSEIEAGMTGYGLSVFQGWEPEEFNVEIIDVMPDYFTGGDLILARLSGANLEVSGVVAGMSGSPVYIDDKLIGAVAYTWTYTKEPICGITPIEMMLDMKENADYDYFDNDGMIKRISMPVSVSGITGAPFDYLKEVFTDSGFILSEGMGAGSKTADDPTLEAGDAVAVKMISGDYDMSSIGTVTYVSNNDVFIYGHPLYTMGNISYPISKAYIYTVLSSFELSSKLGATSQTIGSTVFDGRSAVYCELERDPYMVPMNVNVSTPENEKDYSFEILPDKVYFSYLASVIIGSAIESVMGDWDEKNMSMNFQIECEYEGETYIITNSSAYSLSPSYYSIDLLLVDLSAYFTAFTYADFGDIIINQVDVFVEGTPGVNYYTLEDVTLDKDTYYSGDTVKVESVLKEYMGDYITYDMEFDLPENLISGTYTVYVGSELTVYNSTVSLFPYLYTQNTMESLVELANNQAEYSVLKAAFFDFNEGLMYYDEALDSFPEAYISLFNIRNDDNGKNYAFPETVGNSISLDAPVYGSEEISISIRNEHIVEVK